MSRRSLVQQHLTKKQNQLLVKMFGQTLNLNQQASAPSLSGLARAGWNRGFSESSSHIPAAEKAGAGISVCQ